MGKMLGVTPRHLLTRLSAAREQSAGWRAASGGDGGSYGDWGGYDGGHGGHGGGHDGGCDQGRPHRLCFDPNSWPCRLQPAPPFVTPTTQTLILTPPQENVMKKREEKLLQKHTGGPKINW